MGVCAYEVHQAMGDTLVSGFNSRLITAEERVRLADELHKARRALDVLRTPETRDATNDGTSSDPSYARTSGTDRRRRRYGSYGAVGARARASRDRERAERRADRVARRGGSVRAGAARRRRLFLLGDRRGGTAAARAFDEARASPRGGNPRAFVSLKRLKRPDGGRAAVVKALIKAVREACGVSMTAREAERVIEALGKPEEGPGEESAKREGSTSSTDR